MSSLQRWCLRDYGTLQYLWDTLAWTGFLIHERGAEGDRGPWELVDREGDAHLQRIREDEGVMEELNPLDVPGVHVVDVDATGDLVVKARFGDEPAEFVRLQTWQNQSRLKKTMKFLNIPLADSTTFGCEFTWTEYPLQCGDKPVSVWMSFPKVVEYVMGKNAMSRCRKLVKQLWRVLDSHGLAREHCRKAEDLQPECDDHIRANSQNWLVSVLACTIWLEYRVYDGYCSREARRLGSSAPKEVEDTKAKLLLEMLFTWPRCGQDRIAFAMPRSGCELLLKGMQVDCGILHASEERKNPVDRSR